MNRRHDLRPGDPMLSLSESLVIYDTGDRSNSNNSTVNAVNAGVSSILEESNPNGSAPLQIHRLNDTRIIEDFRIRNNPSDIRLTPIPRIRTNSRLNNFFNVQSMLASSEEDPMLEELPEEGEHEYNNAVYDPIPEWEFSFFSDSHTCAYDSQEHLEKYGTIAIKTFKRLFDRSLLFLSIVNESIYRKIVDGYFNVSERENKNGINLNVTRRFIKCLPKLKYISKMVAGYNKINDAKNFRNVYFSKMCLDILEDYLKKVDKPLFEVYYRKFLPVAMKFYSKISDENYLKICTEMKSSQIMFYNKRCNVIWSKEDQILTYQKERNELLNLNGGLTLKSKKFIQ